jgi:hypothetical protein
MQRLVYGNEGMGGMSVGGQNLGIRRKENPRDRVNGNHHQPDDGVHVREWKIDFVVDRQW